MTEGTELYLMDSGPDAQLETATAVVRSAIDGQGEQFEAAGALAFDCICQGDILGEQFGDATDRMASAVGAPLAGMQTYGEVSMADGDMRAYHNSTSSVVVFPE